MMTSLNNEIFVLEKNILWKFDVMNETCFKLAEMNLSFDNRISGIMASRDHIYAIQYDEHVPKILLQFNLESKTWSTITKLVYGVCNSTAFIYDDYLYISGGRNHLDCGLNKKVSRCMLTCDNIFDQRIGKGMNIAREYAACCFLNNCLYIIGGATCTARSSTCIERFNFNHLNPSWEIVASMLIPRRCADVIVKDGLIYVIGGIGSDNFVREMECYDPKSNKWEIVAEMPSCISQFDKSNVKCAMLKVPCSSLKNRVG